MEKTKGFDCEFKIVLLGESKFNNYILFQVQ